MRKLLLAALGVVLVAPAPARGDVTGGLFSSLSGQLREQRRNGYRVRPTRLRGQRAYALARYQERMLL